MELMRAFREYKEKVKAIWHILTDDEYAIYTVTIKDDKIIKGRNCNIISDNASDFFLKTICKFNNKYIEKNNTKIN